MQDGWSIILRSGWKREEISQKAMGEERSLKSVEAGCVIGLLGMPKDPLKTNQP